MLGGGIVRPSHDDVKARRRRSFHHERNIRRGITTLLWFAGNTPNLSYEL